MFVAFLPRGNSLERVPIPEGGSVPAGAIWLDLVSPTIEEDRAVEAAVGVGVPTREEMAEIEPSSRLYIENNARYMTATLICHADSERPATTAITFILASGRLVTVRYEDPRPFAIVGAKLGRVCPPTATGESVLIDLLDAIIDRAADILERIAAEVDLVSRRIFERRTARSDQRQSYQAILRAIGRKGDLTSKVRESLVSIGRLVLFLANEAEGLKLQKDQRTLVQSMARDVASLTDHASFLAHKIQFLLEATLGMVTLEQNNVIKIFSVAAVVLLPPTMIASIYGMNFKHMPELDWTLGYPMALLLMLASAVLPYTFFKWKRWL
ncbi:MAG: magnesium transporter CorA family protein [Xanthobacteraceae bacterium]|nr:magnesium transporter CorA family protein [Xanthobacteraceae bacterium]